MTPLSHRKRPFASATRRGYGERPRNAIPRRSLLIRAAAGRETALDPGTRSAPVARLEAALFLAEEPLPIRRLTEVAGLKDATETRRVLAQLEELIKSAGGAFRVEEIAGGYQLLTAARCEFWLGRLRRAGHMIRLTPALLETLTVLAYKQPFPRADLDAVRGVDCGDQLRILLERGLVRTMGRQDSLGRPQLYGTSKLFLQMFGFKAIDNLPQLAE